MAFDPKLQRRIMGHFATGVTVVTTRYDNNELWGMTANSVVSVSLDPPLLMMTVERHNHMYDAMVAGQCFAVNILTLEQEAISRRFATRGPKDFSDLDLMYAETGAPILVGALAYADCRIVQVLPGGDHEIFVGEIVAGEAFDGQPLIFYGGKYSQLVPPLVAEAVPVICWTLEETFDNYGCF